MSSDLIRYENVTKRFGDVTAAEDISFTVKESEFLALLGPSGAGKTTLLRLLAGFENVSEGKIVLDGIDITGVPPQNRDTGMVFQNYALFPHLIVKENIAFGLKQNGFDNIDERISEVLEIMEMSGMKDRKPSELSGGQQQRVATARAIAIEPSVLLMDEPLGALDKKLREQLQVELKNLQDRLGITTVYVTHNQSEALTMADRIIVMNHGTIEQIGTPTEIYQSPKTEFVADFIGDTNFLEGEFEYDGDESRFVLKSGQQLLVNPASVDGRSNNKKVFVRPEKISITRPDDVTETNGQNVLSGRISEQIFLGSEIRYFVDVGDDEVLVKTQGIDSTRLFETGDEVVVKWSREDTQTVTANS